MGAGARRRPLHVVVVVQDAIRNRLLAALLDHMPPGSWSPHFVVAGKEGPLADQVLARGASFQALGVDEPRNLPLLASRLRGVLTRRCDLVHSHQFLPAAAVEVARRTLRHRPPSVMTRHHDVAHHLGRRHVHVAVDRWTARSADHVIAVSVAVRATLVDREGVDSARVSVVPNGVDFASFRVDDVARSKWRERARGRALAVAVGRLDRLKDYPTLLAAIAEVRLTHPHIVLFVAGDGPIETRREIEGHIRRLGLSDAVELLGWVDDVQSLVSAADVFVQSSMTEAAPQAILEAVGLDVPVAVTTPGGAAEVVIPWYDPIPPGDASGIARRVRWVIDFPEEARRTAMLAGVGVRARFSARHMADRHLEVYRELVARRR